MNEKMDKKQIKLTIIAVVTLVALVAGATYAYFQVGTSNLFGTSTINATADRIGTVTLNGSNATLSMNLTAVDMMRGNSNITYYASSNGKTTTPTEETIGVATVFPTDDTNYYHCTYTLEVNHFGINDMYDLFNHQSFVQEHVSSKGELYKVENTIIKEKTKPNLNKIGMYYDYENRDAGQIILTVNGEDYDFVDEWSETIDGEFYIKAPNEVEITAGLRFINTANIDQTYLAGSDIQVTIGVKANTFSCTAEVEPAAPTQTITYWTYEGEYVTGSTAHKVSDYRNLNVYRRFDSTYNNGMGTYYIYPASDLATCENDNGGVACESVTQPFFIKETAREVSTTETMYEIFASEDNGSTYSTLGTYTASELSDIETQIGTTLTCDGETVTDVGGTPVKCETYLPGAISFTQYEYEVCANVNNTIICMAENAWEDSAFIESLLGNPEFICNYYDSDTDEWSYTKKPSNGKLACTTFGDKSQHVEIVLRSDGVSACGSPWNSQDGCTFHSPSSASCSAYGLNI